MADQTWKEFFEGWLLNIVEFAAHHPKDFLMYFFICLTPIMLCSGVLAYIMIKELDHKEKEKKKKGTKQANLAKTRRKAVKTD